MTIRSGTTMLLVALLAAGVTLPALSCPAHAQVRARADVACRQADGHLIRVETSSQDAYSGTLQFYLDTGYLEGGRLPGFYKPGDDLVILYKLL